MIILGLIGVTGQVLLTPPADAQWMVEDGTLAFDVWVNGKHTRRLIGAGVASGSVYHDWVYVSVVPHTKTGQVDATVTIVPFVTGTNTIGVGYKGYNIGFTVDTFAGQPIVVDVRWGEWVWDIRNYFGQDCDSGARILYINAGLGDIKSVIASVGPFFTEADDLYMKATTDIGWLGGDDAAFHLWRCYGAFHLESDNLPSRATQLFLKVRDWTGTITEIPRSIKVMNPDHNLPRPWRGYTFLMEGGLSGTFTGVVEKGPFSVPVSVHAVGITALGVHGKTDDNPYAAVNVAFETPGDRVRVRILDSDNIDLTAKLQPDGTVYFDNVAALDKVVPVGECRLAYLNILEECALEW